MYMRIQSGRNPLGLWSAGFDKNVFNRGFDVLQNQQYLKRLLLNPLPCKGSLILGVKRRNYEGTYSENVPNSQSSAQDIIFDAA